MMMTMRRSRVVGNTEVDWNKMWIKNGNEAGGPARLPRDALDQEAPAKARSPSALEVLHQRKGAYSSLWAFT
jgi:hypothetical protein